MEDFDFTFTRARCCCCVTCVVLIVLAILLAVSFRTIETNEIGIKVQRHMNYVIDRGFVYEAGMYFVGPWGSFSTLSKATQNTVYTVVCNTQNVVEVKLEVSIQYQVQESYDHFHMILFGYDNYFEFFDLAMQSAIRQGCQSLKSDIVYDSRAVVTSTLQEYVGRAITKTAHSLLTLQVVDIKVPDQMEERIIELVKSTQDIDIATNERNVNLATANNQKAQDIHKATMAAAAKNKTMDAAYNARKNEADARLYAKRQDIQIFKDRVAMFDSKFTDGTTNKFMKIEALLTEQYVTLLENLGLDGTNQMYISHKPTAVMDIFDKMKTRISAAKVETD